MLPARVVAVILSNLIKKWNVGATAVACGGDGRENV